MKVLVTGAAGEVAPGIIRTLCRHYDLRLTDLRRSEAFPEAEWQEGSILDEAFLERLTEGVDAVVHTAVVRKAPGREFTTGEFFDVNVKGLYLLLEKAEAAGVKVLVHIGSTAPVIGHWFEGRDITVESPLTTRGRYSLTKALQEVICEHMSRNSDMRFVVLRPWVPCDRLERTGGQGGEAPRDYSPGLIDTEDLGEACRLAIENGDLGKYEVFHTVATREARARFDFDRTRDVLGFTPSEDFETLRGRDALSSR